MFGAYYRHLAPIIGTPSAGLVNYQNHNIFHCGCTLNISEIVESQKYGFRSF